jgi:hypothetical protein
VHSSLVAVLGRSDLAIAYWLPDAERWVDLEGRRQAVDLSERGVTPVTYRGRPPGGPVPRPAARRGEDLSARIAAVNGTLEIDSRPTAGKVVRARLPVAD